MLYKYEFRENALSNRLTQLHLKLDNIIFPIYDKGIEVVFRNQKKRFDFSPFHSAVYPAICFYAKVDDAQAGPCRDTDEDRLE